MTRERKSSPQTLRLLAAFLERPLAWRHGYELSTETELKAGTLYPVLMRLHDRGLLDSKWEPSELPGRPPRRMYKLTTQGRALAKEQLASAARAVMTLNPAGGRA
jgi:PadR family transcriptional regulator, regulatory protein PadR